MTGGSELARLEDDLAEFWRTHGGPDTGGPVEKGDLLIADRFVAERGQDYRYAPGIGWLRWDGAVWVRCDLGEQVEAVKGVARRMITQPDADARTAWAAMQEPRVKGALRLAEVDPSIATAAGMLDANPHLLATPAGTVHLGDGRLRPARRDDLLTWATSTGPADEVAPAWTAFLEQVQPDPQVREFLQRLIGSAVVGTVTDHILPVFHGAGANGKSVFTSVLSRVLGDYAHSAPVDLLLAGRRSGSSPTPEVADLRGRRLVVVSESQEDGRLAVERVKALTGGDEMVGRFLYRDLIRFRPSHTIFMVTNHRPRIEDDGHAIWRRVLLVPWTVAIPEGQQDRGLADRLAGEAAPGVLRWVIDGARQYLRGGLQIPDSIQAATSDYRSREDWFGAWLAERTVEHDAATVRAGELMADYRTWAASSAGPALTDAAMRERLEARGFRPEKLSGRVTWIGLRLADGEPS